MRTTAFRDLVWSSTSSAPFHRTGILESCLFLEDLTSETWDPRIPVQVASNLLPVSVFSDSVPRVGLITGLCMPKSGSWSGGNWARGDRVEISWMDLSIHVCAHTAPHGAEGSWEGKQRKFVCDQGGARDQLPPCYPISTQNSESENYDFGLSLPG